MMREGPRTFGEKERRRGRSLRGEKGLIISILEDFSKLF